MAPYYAGYDPDMSLHDDDVRAIRHLYGEGGSETETDAATESPAVLKDVCSGDGGGVVDTVFGTAEGQYYAFRGSYSYKLTDTGVAQGYPRLISEEWPGLPNNIDAG